MALLDGLTHLRFNKWLERKVKTAILKDFLVWHVIPNPINNRSHYFNKGDHVAGMMHARAYRNTSGPDGKYLQ